MARSTFFLSTTLLLLALGAMIQRSQAVEYSVTNTAETTPGGARFNSEIGVEYSQQTLTSATDFIWNLFQQTNPVDRKDVQRVSLFVDDMDGIAYASNNEIHVSARWLGGIQGDLKRDFDGVIYHEMTHVWQWNGNRQAPSGLIEGIADFVRLKAGYIPGHWVKPGEGNKWDEGYDKTARFLEYCESLQGGFVAQLNKKMRDSYSDQFFVDLLGKTVDQLWQDYKAKYNM